MKIALYYPRNLFASWFSLGGYARTLRTMGHEVIDCPFPGNIPNDIENVRARMPTIPELLTCDCVLSTFHEYIVPWLGAVYGPDEWRRLMCDVPVIARLDESMDRKDLFLQERWPELAQWAQAGHFFFPAKQDAIRYDGHWLPFGADLTMFNTNINKVKLYDIGFIGSMYPLRMNYMQKLSEHLDSRFTFNVGTVVVQDLSGIRGEESTQLLADNYSRIKIFFCLPPMSRLLVCKVFEVMASGTFMMFPKLPGKAAANLALFEDGKEIVYYDYGNVESNAHQIRHWLEHEGEREHIAQMGCHKVQSKFSLEQMLGEMLYVVMGSEKAFPKLTREGRIRLGIGTDAQPAHVKLCAGVAW